MRTSVGLDDTGSTMVSSPETTAASMERGGNGTRVPHSAWQSPMPYLFGGLAAMLGLIAFALLILACSYWKLSGFLESDRAEEVESKPEEKPTPAWYEEGIVVIMAGEEKPRYLATPICSNSCITPTRVGRSSGEVEMNKVIDSTEGLRSSSSSYDENNRLNHEQNQEE